MLRETVPHDDLRVRRWLPWRSAAPLATKRLFCFPFAGGSAAVYRRWAERLAGVEVCPVELPGHATRLRDPLIYSMPNLVAELVALMDALNDLPFGFFGHSMGALIAFDLAQSLAATGRSGPDWLIASAARSPDRVRTGGTQRRSDEELVEGLRRLDGTPAEILASPEILARSLPIIRADYGLVESRVRPSSDRLACDLLTITGREDPLVTADHAAEWRRFTLGRHEELEVTGGHFFLHDPPRPLFTAVADLLGRRPA